jgi:hypothetical protein
MTNTFKALVQALTQAIKHFAAHKCGLVFFDIKQAPSSPLRIHQGE